MARPEDHTLAGELARETGEVVIDARASLIRQGAGPWQLGDAGDMTAHGYLIRELALRRPGDAVLSEESSDKDRSDPARLAADRVWIIDPVDGTREFGAGRHDWAVHVALVEAGQPTAAAVGLPDLGVVVSTAAPPKLLPCADRPRIVVSRSRPPIESMQVAAALSAELVPMGSAGYKSMAVVRGEAEIYIHSGGQHEWDSAAPVGVARASGLWCSRIDGSPLSYNHADTYLPDLLICRTEYVRAILDVLN